MAVIRKLFSEEILKGSISFKVEGKPQGKARPRFSRRSGAVYTPSATKAYEKQIADAYREAAHGGKFTISVGIIVMACFPIPKSWPKAKKLQAMKGELRPGKPDIDNILKIVLDGLNGVAYDDDSLVTEASCTKMYVFEPDDAGHLTVIVAGG